MQIAIDSGQGHIITAYSSDSIAVNQVSHANSFIINNDQLISDWPIKSLSQLSLDKIADYLNEATELVLVGSNNPFPLPYELIEQLSLKRIGFECMSLDAACRTYSVLNSEARNFLAAFIL